MKAAWAMVMAFAAVAAGPAAAAQVEFVDAVDYPANAEGWSAFRDLERRLEVDFDQICGDTFCEGDYSDYRPLRLRCSVERYSGVLAHCTWTFGASEISVDARTGRLLVDSRTWRCPLALPAGLTLPALYDALAGAQPLFQALPGGDPLYDSLIGCL